MDSTRKKKENNDNYCTNSKAADANNLGNEKIHFKRDKQERQLKFTNKRTLVFQFMRVISEHFYNKKDG